MPDWPIGLSTGCFHDVSIFDCLEKIRAAGFGMVEICSSAPHLDYHDPDTVKEAAELLERLGMEAYSFHAPFAKHIDISSLEDEHRNRSVQEMRLAADAAANLGVRHFVVHPGPEASQFAEDERLPRLQQVVRSLDEVAEHCRTVGLDLVLENMLPHLFTGPVQDLLWIYGAMRAHGVRLCLDTGHAHLAGDWPAVARKMAPHLCMLHANDNHRTYDDHLPPGDGDIDWVPLASTLESMPFRGSCILEIAGNADPEHILINARRGRLFLRHLGMTAQG